MNSRFLFFIFLIIHSISFSQSGTECIIDDSNIETAVDLWESDQASAEATYGDISIWDTSCVTDMSELFKNFTSFNEIIS